MSAAAADNDLSEYERQRLANIARNTAVLASLGLDDKDKRQKEALNAQHKNVIAFARATRRSMKPDSHRLKLHAGVRRSERHISDLIAGIKNVGTRTHG